MSTALKYLLLCSLPFLARQVQMACKRSGWSVIETMQICMFDCERDVSHTYGMTVTGQAVGFFFLKHLRCWLEFPNCYLFEKAHKRTPFTVTASLKVFQCCFFSLLNCFLSMQCIFIAFAATAGLQIYPHFYLRIPKNIFFLYIENQAGFQRQRNDPTEEGPSDSLGVVFPLLPSCPFFKENFLDFFFFFIIPMQSGKKGKVQQTDVLRAKCKNHPFSLGSNTGPFCILIKKSAR